MNHQPEDPLRGLCQYLMDDIAMDVCETVLATFGFKGQLLVVDAHAMQDRGVQIVNVDRIVGNVV